MSIPFGNEDVTLVQRCEYVVDGKTRVTYESVLLTGCSWRRSTRMNRSMETMEHQESVICRVPDGQARPQPGDLMILGNADVAVTSGADFNALVEQFRDSDGAFVVTSVNDNARPGMPMPHYCARGA